MRRPNKAWQGLIKSIAPRVGLALGGPFAGLATQTLANTLFPDQSGVKQSASLTKLLSGPLTGDAVMLEKLRQAEKKFDVQMRKLDVEIETLHVQDRNAAPAISSRWISTRPQSRPFFKIAPCTDFTSDDLPVPRAPHNSALFAGNRLAKAVVLVISKSRCSSTPRNKSSAKRLTAVTATNWRMSECQTYASAVTSDALSGAGGHWRSSALAIRVNCCKMALSVKFDIANALNKRFVS